VEKEAGTCKKKYLAKEGGSTNGSKTFLAE
jgi:hypothetical protein